MTTNLGEPSETATLIEKLTQLITVQQNQLMVMQQTPSNTLPPPLISSLPSPIIETSLNPPNILIKLDGKNYSLWSQSVRMYIKGRQKLKHITDPSRAANDPLFEKWDIDDTVVKGWICNSLDINLYGKFLRYPTAKEVWKAIATTFYDGSDTAQVFDLNKRVNNVKQSGRNIEEYYNELQDLWLEIDFRRPNPMMCATNIEKFDKFIQESRVYVFLDGLDDKLDGERANVLQMTPFPTIEQAFARVRKEASRQEIMNKGDKGTAQISAAMVSKAQRNFEVNHSSNRNSSYVDKSSLKCSHCRKKGHIIEQCFQIVGYPEWFKDKNRGKNNWLGKGRVSIAHADSGGNSTQQVPQVQVQAHGTAPTQPSAQNQKMYWSESNNVRTQGETGQHSGQGGSQAAGLHMASFGGSTISPLGTSGTITNQGYPNQEDFGLWY